jgi:hypothetical protein
MEDSCKKARRQLPSAEEPEQVNQTKSEVASEPRAERESKPQPELEPEPQPESDFATDASQRGTPRLTAGLSSVEEETKRLAPLAADPPRSSVASGSLGPAANENVQMTRSADWAISCYGEDYDELLARSFDWVASGRKGNLAHLQDDGGLPKKTKSRPVKLSETRNLRGTQSADLVSTTQAHTCLSPLDVDRSTRKAIRRCLRRSVDSQSLRGVKLQSLRDVKSQRLRERLSIIAPASVGPLPEVSSEQKIALMKQCADELRSTSEARWQWLQAVEKAQEAKRKSTATTRAARMNELDRQIAELS